MLEVTLVGILAAMSFSFEAIQIKWLLTQGVDGPPGGYIALFFDGVYGLILLSVLTFMGQGIQ